MKILLSYSRLHFDPDKKPEEHKYWGTSASILSRTLYKILSKLGEVIYIDSNHFESIKNKKFDLFVGINNNFNKILKSCQIKKSIYFAVNMHPRERNKILIRFLLNERINPLALASWDIINFFVAEEGINIADYVLCLGNNTVYNSYIKHGVPKSKIKMLNYGVDTIPVKMLKNSIGRKIKKYVYVTSEIGLRKGFDIVYSLFTDPEIIKRKFHLDIVGLPTNNYYQKKLEKFQKKLLDKVDYHRWIDSSSQQYKELLRSSDFVILPSLEEGQAGSVLDAINFGVIPIISQKTGIDFSPLGQLEPKINSNHNKDIILSSLNLSAKEILNLKNKTLEYYLEYHSSYIENLEGAIKDCIKGQLFPKISVILPIFNKEKTIKLLISFLHRACLEYKNVEVHIIFDGCTDKSEEIVRNFYRDIKSYKITFEKTPNIFEVKTNNIGLKKSTGKYCVVIQDDNYIFDKNIFFEAVNFLDKNSQVAILGCLSGVNYYPRGTKLVGLGQIAMDKSEVYHRQDEKTDPELKKRIFEVDACMRGPLIFRKSFLEKYGYLDEIFAPLHHDDMDICFRARYYGFKIYCILSDVINASLTVAKYNQDKWKYWMKIYSRNSDILYSRWKPSISKNYLWIHRVPITYSYIDRVIYALYKLEFEEMKVMSKFREILYYVFKI